MFFKSHELMLL